VTNGLYAPNLTRELLDDGSVKSQLEYGSVSECDGINTMGTVIPSAVFGRIMAKQKKVIINITP